MVPIKQGGGLESDLDEEAQFWQMDQERPLQKGNSWVKMQERWVRQKEQQWPQASSRERKTRRAG